MTFPRPALAAVLVLALFAPSARAQDSTPPATDVDQLPEVLAECEPVMPDKAREARVEGTVLVEVLVGTDGWARESRIVRSIPLLDDAAERCANQYKFEPARHRGRRVEVWLAVPITFRLPPEPPSWKPGPKPQRPSETMAKPDSAPAQAGRAVPPKIQIGLPQLPPVPVSGKASARAKEPGRPKATRDDSSAGADAGDEESAAEDEESATEDDGEREAPKPVKRAAAAEDPAEDDSTATEETTTDDAEEEPAPIDDSESEVEDEPRRRLEEDRAPAAPRIEVKVTPAPDLDLQRALASLRRGPRRPPSLDEALVREDVIRRLRASGLPTQPHAGAEDQLARLAATLTADAERDSLRDAASALVELTREWPAWATPYRELARALELLESPARAAICLELYLVAAPDAPDWRHVRQWLSRLRAEASESQ